MLNSLHHTSLTDTLVVMHSRISLSLADFRISYVCLLSLRYARPLWEIYPLHHCYIDTLGVVTMINSHRMRQMNRTTRYDNAVAEIFRFGKYWWSQACPPVKSELSSLDFVVNRFFLWKCLERLMLNMPPAGQLCRLWHQCQIVAIVSSIIITPVCLFNFFLLLIACMRVCVNLSFLR